MWSNVSLVIDKEISQNIWNNEYLICCAALCSTCVSVCLLVSPYDRKENYSWSITTAFQREPPQFLLISAKWLLNVQVSHELHERKTIKVAALETNVYFFVFYRAFSLKIKIESLVVCLLLGFVRLSKCSTITFDVLISSDSLVIFKCRPVCQLFLKLHLNLIYFSATLRLIN